MTGPSPDFSTQKLCGRVIDGLGTERQIEVGVEVGRNGTGESMAGPGLGHVQIRPHAKPRYVSGRSAVTGP